jgi:hypothetical protein
MTCGQRMQAARPSWEYHRHSFRMTQAGKLSTTGGNIFATRVANRQSAPSK